MYRTVFIVLALTTLCTTLDAQQDALLRSGDRIRISVPQAFRAPVTGTLVARGPGVLTIARSGDAADTVDIPEALIRTVEVSRGHLSRGRGVRRGLVQGFAAGATVGAVIRGILGLGAGDGGEAENGVAASAKVAARFGVIGAVAGGVLGLREREHWERLAVPGLSIAVRGPSPSVVFSLTF